MKINKNKIDFNYSSGSWPRVQFGASSSDIGKLLLINSVKLAVVNSGITDNAVSLTTYNPLVLVFNGYTWEYLSACNLATKDLMPITGFHTNTYTVLTDTTKAFQIFRMFGGYAGGTSSDGLEYNHNTALWSTIISLPAVELDIKLSRYSVNLAWFSGLSNQALYSSLSYAMFTLTNPASLPVAPCFGGTNYYQHDYSPSPAPGSIRPTRFGGGVSSIPITTALSLRPTDLSYVTEVALGTARWKANAAQVQCGVCITSGLDSSANVLTSHVYYAFPTASYIAKSDLPAPARVGCIAGDVESTKFIVACGWDNVINFYTDVDLYSLISDAWTTGTDYPASVAYPAGGARGCNMYVSGGATNALLNTTVTTTRQYSSISGSWTTLTALSTGRCRAASNTF